MWVRLVTMGQFVSKSKVVTGITAEDPSYTQLFVEHHNDSFYVPLIRRNVKYNITLDNSGQVALDSKYVCRLQSDGLSFDIELQENQSGYSFTLNRSCPTNYYRLSCLDINALVYIEEEEEPNGPLLDMTSFNKIDVWLPDGQEFRNLIGFLENSINGLQKNSTWKIFLENLSKFSDLLVSLSSTCTNLQKFKISLNNNQDHPLKKLINVELQKWLNTFKHTIVDRLSQDLNKDVISPLQDFIEFEKQNSKVLLKRQKIFNESIKSMYAAPSSSLTTLDSRVQFDLSRLEYQDYLYQCYIIGSPLRNLYSSLSIFLQKPLTNEISRFNDNYTEHNNRLMSSIKHAKKLSDLSKLYSSSKSPHVENFLLVKTSSNDMESSMSSPNANTSNTISNSAASHWQKRWVILNGHFLDIFYNSKKAPFQSINLTFACIKPVNKTSLEIITSGSPSTSSLLTTVNSSSSSSEQDVQTRIFLQFSNELDARNWLNALQQSNLDTKKEPSHSPATMASTFVPQPRIHDYSMIDQVINQHESNSKCCDCNNSETVEWISINLLCVLCIKCSGVHRSMGSHISKVRSLTLDNFVSPEVLHLLRKNVSNANVNSIYESNRVKGSKISAQSSDAERSQYIIDKYQSKKMVDDGNQGAKDSLRSLIKAIHLNSIYLLQKTIAQSKLPLKEIVNEQASTSDDEKSPTIFQYSLKHHEMVNGKPVFYITEFLLFNGIPVDKLPANKTQWSASVIDYWKNKIDVYGTYSPSDIPAVAVSHQRSTLPPLTIPPEKTTNKRWSLNHMPNSAQIKSPTNLLNMHKSLKLPKRGSSSRKE